MPPKAAKKGSAKKSNAAGGANKNWEAGLTKAQFEEESWQACVSMVVGSSPEEEEELMKALALAVQQPQRKLFSLLTWDGTHAKIHELGNTKAKKTDDFPLFYEVTEPAKVLLDAGEEIPGDLMANLLKFQLLEVKANDQQRREAEKSEGEKAKVKPSSDSKDKGGAKVPDQKEKKTKLKRRDDVDPPTYIDDEPDDGPQHYILLLGFHQPHLIALLDAIGVRVANVIRLCSEHGQTAEGPQELPGGEDNEQSLRASPVLDAETAVHASVELARKLDLFWSGLRSVLDSGPPDSQLHDVVQLSYAVKDPSLPFHTQDPEAVMELGSRIFEGVATLIYDCLDWRRQHQHYRNNLKLLDVPLVSGLDSQPEEPAVLRTPRSKKKSAREDQEEAKQQVLSVDVDMCYYDSLLDLVPPEAYTVPLILHCMLEQVAISANESALPHVEELPRPADASWLDHQLVSYMLQSFLPLAGTDEEKSRMLNNLLTTVQNDEDKKRLVEKFGAVEAQKKSEQLVIRHHDQRALRLRDINPAQGFSPSDVEVSVMRLSPVWKLIESVAQDRNSDSCWMQLKQQLQYYCTDDVLSWPEVERLFHQSVFEAMPLTRLDQHGVLQYVAKPLGGLEQAQQHAPTIIPWDNPLSYAKQQLHSLRTKGLVFLTEDPENAEFSGRVCSQLDLSDMQSCRMRSLFDWHYAEHHDATVFPQVLQLAAEEHQCLDAFRGSHKNILYVCCHDPMSPHRQSKELWDAALHTDVKFRKYLEHVADSISNWTREEELKRAAMQIRNDSPADSQKSKGPDENAECPVQQEGTVEPVIRKDSLKAWKLEQERLKEEEMNKKSKKDNVPKGKQQKEDGRSTDNNKSKTPSGKKNRPETAGSTRKTPAGSVITTAPPMDESKELHLTEEPFNGFIGYSMDGQLIRVSGRLQNLFPSDGGRITVENISYVEGSSLMKVTVKKDGHRFHTHISHTSIKKSSDPKNDCKAPKPAEMRRVKQGSLSAVLSNGIHLSYSFYGPTGENTANSQEAETPENPITDPVPLSSSTNRSKRTDVESLPSKTKTPSSQTRPPESQGCEGQPALPSNPFNSLSMSVPNGLLLQFLPEDTQEDKSIMVRQSFPLHARGEMSHLQDAPLSKEVSRVITCQGAVIRYMRDGSTEVLFANGSVSFSQDSGPVWVPDSEVQEEISNQEAEEDNEEQSTGKEAEAQRGCWLTTTPSGDRIYTVGTTHKHIPTTSLLTFKATDPSTHQVMLNREDLVVLVQNPDGSLIVEHADGTRMTSLYQDRPLNAEQHTGDHPESVTPKSTSQFVSGSTEYECVTRCVDSISENTHAQDVCDKKEKNSRNSAESTRDKEASAHACTKLSEIMSGESSAHNSSEQSLSVEGSPTENRKASVCESEKGSSSTKERVVLVEKEGCASVVMYPERHTAHIFLADGTVVTGNHQGEYQVFPSGAGLLHIQRDGKCVYSSDPLVTPSPKGSTPTNQPGMYTMSHTEMVACDITDPDGNHFQVMEDGQISVLNFSPAPSTLKHYEEELELQEEEDREITRIHAKHRENSPRLFLVREDGSGTELLSSHAVEELLYQAYSDPTIALLKEPLSDTQDEFGITILKPSHQSVWSQWLLGKQNPDITPPNFRNRSWHDFPRAETKTKGPQFGTDIGRGLTLRARPGGSSAAQQQPVKTCPRVLEMRELYQHRPFTTPLKNTIDSRLKEYIESLMEREQRSEEMKVKDPRTEEDSANASDLLSLILSFEEEDDPSHKIKKNVSVEVASMYREGVRAPDEHSDVSEDSTTASTDSLERFKNCTTAKDSKWTERLAQHRQEMYAEKTHKEALRKKDVVPFFHPENTPLYQCRPRLQTPDMRSLSMDLPPIPTSHSAESFLKDAPQESTPRPLNPTPSQSASHATGSERKPEERPTTPTEHIVGENGLRGSSRQYGSVHVDVTGKPRRTKVRLPTSILSSKPRSKPNQQFLTVEEPVRRRCRTISLTDPAAVVRGFHLLPSSVDFGTLQEGTTSAITVVMKNVGVDTCRFHVKQPPPATGLRVIYSPGPVAAGLQVELQVQLFAMCATQAGEAEPKRHVSQDVIIHTETEILYLPVTATILPERSYDIWLREHTGAHKKKGSRLPAARGIHAQMNQHF
ncbi:sperm-associated antigen 17 isoform X2 [Mugil cephalus]|uniref:sperm-associated antigen 17 isoform X2 n=1 Tax=Mugil cephalus TaxID=48193 RepID=UPI001FB57AFE|nr:sperm-associated antigen 17 isoform X2 [Mugil cephalus]